MIMLPAVMLFFYGDRLLGLLRESTWRIRPSEDHRPLQLSCGLLFPIHPHSECEDEGESIVKLNALRCILLLIELFYGKSIWDSGSRACLDNLYGDRYLGGMGGIKEKSGFKEAELPTLRRH